MAALGKLTAALMAGSQENTLALAALNFDFSLWKVEAPSEYKALGTLLSKERLVVAESGNHHITSRRLGALFRSKIPRVENLHRAYGTRVSEIAKSATLEKPPQNLGLFDKQLGIDGTSIWAAATSGHEALSVQLLACMLARIWPVPEATAIWAEIVEARKQELKDGDGDFDLHEIAASQANITREQLAEWDSSARAWIRTADGIMKKQQVQLRIIVNNINTSVNDKGAMYESVMNAWISAMEVVDGLVGGKPQSVYDGSVLLALTAWHLYPNMIVFQEQFTTIDQKDELIPESGILTIGLQSSPNRADGVRWSLPLTRLRYYGAPVIKTETLGARNSRITMQELLYVTLGCLSGSWSRERGGSRGGTTSPNAELIDMCEYYTRLWEWTTATYREENESVDLGKKDKVSLSWLFNIAEAASTFLSSKQADNKTMMKLIRFGKRHGKRFLGDQLNFHYQTWSMTKLPTFQRLLYPAKRIEYLRHVAASDSHTRNNEDWIIVSFTRKAESVWITSALPSALEPKNSNRGHYSYVIGYLGKSSSWNQVDIPALTARQSHDQVWENAKDFCSASFSGSPEGSEVTFDFSANSYQAKNQAKKWVGPPQRESGTRFTMVAGNPFGEALYRRVVDARPTKSGLSHNNEDSVSVQVVEVPLNDIYRAFERRWIDPKKMDRGFWLPMSILGAAVDTYKEFPELTISMNVISTSLQQQMWASYGEERASANWYDIIPMNRRSIFSCIAFFETGDLQLNPTDLEAVIGMSVEDSLYVSGCVVDDPFTHRPNDRVYRALGNIGKPGVCLLIPPAQPWVRKRQNDDWLLVNHEDYDGKPENSFQNTSMHLSLTDYRQPYQTGKHSGNREWDAYFQESVISIHDRGVWVGDVDILQALEVTKVAKGCKHAGKRGLSWFSKEGVKLTSIDNWHELIDAPKNAAVVRSHRNTFGRLATAVFSAQLGFRTIILPEVPCNECFKDHDSFKRWIEQNSEFCEVDDGVTGPVFIY